MSKSKTDFYLVKEIMELTKTLEQSKINNDSSNIIATLFKMRVIHGKMILKLFNMKQNMSRMPEIGDRDLYDLSFYEGLTNSINDMLSQEEAIGKDTIKEQPDEELYHTDKPSLILFYTNWCKHSINFLPVWEKLSKVIKSNKINLIKIECSDRKDMCKQFNVKQYPTVKLFYNKSIYDFNGERSVKNLISFLKKNIDPSSNVVSSSSKSQKELPVSPLMLTQSAPPVTSNQVDKIIDSDLIIHSPSKQTFSIPLN